MIGHVLGKFNPATRRIMDVTLPASVKAVELVLTDGVDRAMNAYNGWSAASAAKETEK